MVELTQEESATTGLPHQVYSFFTMYMGETEGVGGIFVPTLSGGTLSSALNVEQKQGHVRGASQMKIR